MYVSVTSLTLVQGKVMGMLLDFFPLLIQRCAALLRVREKKKIATNGEQPNNTKSLLVPYHTILFYIAM